MTALQPRSACWLLSLDQPSTLCPVAGNNHTGSTGQYACRWFCVCAREGPAQYMQAPYINPRFLCNKPQIDIYGKLNGSKTATMNAQQPDASSDKQGDLEEHSVPKADLTPLALEVSETPATDSQPYSVFTATHRRILTAIVGLASVASPLSANIYLPLLPLLQTQYKSSAQAVNLTITLYVITQAIMPAFFAPAADAHGRRLVSLITLTIFTVASLGLALNDVTGNRSYVVLILLRALSAIGVAACASITYGIVSDVCIPAQRGTMLGPAISGSNVGNVLGPVIGGLIAWRTGSATWVFALLAIFGAISLVSMMFLLPETARAVVGDGSQGKRALLRGWREHLILGPRWGKQAQHKSDGKSDGEKAAQTSQTDQATSAATAKKQFTIPNPFSCLTIILSKDTALILYLAGCNYAVGYCITASLPQIYTNIYHWSELAVGLAYLPAAVTIFGAGFISGPWNNHKYRKTAREEALPADTHHVDGFPVEKARLRQLWPCFLLTHTATAGLGWAVARRVHPSVPLVLHAVAGFAQSFFFFAFNTLLVDVHPDRPSTASAAASLVRSGLSGIGVAVLQPLVSAVGWGWYFTLMALVVGVSQGVGMVVLLRWGQGWREARRAAEKRRAGA